MQSLAFPQTRDVALFDCSVAVPVTAEFRLCGVVHDETMCILLVLAPLSHGFPVEAQSVHSPTSCTVGFFMATPTVSGCASVVRCLVPCTCQNIVDVSLPHEDCKKDVSAADGPTTSNALDLLQDRNRVSQTCSSPYLCDFYQVEAATMRLGVRAVLGIVLTTTRVSLRRVAWLPRSCHGRKFHVRGRGRGTVGICMVAEVVY